MHLSHGGSAPAHDSGCEGPLALRPVRAAQVLRRVQAKASVPRGISLSLELEESLFVLAHEERLTSALSSLVQNAIDRSEDGALVLLSCRADERGVAIAVEDESAGAQRGELWPVQRAIEAMAGELSLETHAGQGRTVTLRFAAAGQSRLLPLQSPLPTLELERAGHGWQIRVGGG